MNAHDRQRVRMQDLADAYRAVVDAHHTLAKHMAAQENYVLSQHHVAMANVAAGHAGYYQTIVNTFTK